MRRCTYTNYCEALDQSHKQVTCKLWDRVGLDEPGRGNEALSPAKLDRGEINSKHLQPAAAAVGDPGELRR